MGGALGVGLSAVISFSVNFCEPDTRALLLEKVSNIMLDISCFCSNDLMVEVWFATCLLRSMIRAMVSGFTCWVDRVGLSEKLVDVCELFALRFCVGEVSGVLWSRLTMVDSLTSISWCSARPYHLSNGLQSPPSKRNHCKLKLVFYKRSKLGESIAK